MLERFEYFTHFVSLAHKSIIRMKTDVAARFRLRASHVACLYQIGKSESGLNASELSLLCHEDKAGISKALTALRGAALVKPDGDSSDKRYRARWRLTDEGERVYSAFCEAIADVLASCGQGVTDGEREVFYRVFKRITDDMLAYSEESNDVSTKNLP